MTAEKALTPTALNYELIGPMSREIARLISREDSDGGRSA